MTPRLDILPKPQLAIWPELEDIPDHFTLYGGTAIALHLGHRISVDFDFFSSQTFDPDDLLYSLKLLNDCEVVQRAENTLTVRLMRTGPVLVSFFGVPKLGRIQAPHMASDNGLKIAALIDLAGTKVNVVQKRISSKDYIDIIALIKNGLDLPKALAAASLIYGESFNPRVSLMALSYFEGAEMEKIPLKAKRFLQDAVKDVNVAILDELAMELKL